MDLDKCKVIAIIGDVNSGKTNLAVHLLRTYPGKKNIYIYGYPQQLDNFIPLINKTQLSMVEDGIIFIDELQRFFRLYDKNTNREFIEFVSLSAHKNNCLIFTTQLSQNLTKAMEAFVDGFCITRVRDISTLKLGSKIKRVVDNCIDIRRTSWGLFLKDGEFLSNSDYDNIGDGGITTFPYQGIGKDWRNKTSPATCPASCPATCPAGSLPQTLPQNETDIYIQTIKNKNLIEEK
jgi:hypothetical protein